ncbi:MAG: sulfur oxidation c-type cytochrome SoxX [Thiomicrospira sp.]|uniref:sulfur oxidation c-type cytochrome SoxX n=1 Tax=Thiomicrospira sp. TaxID=935 RepID=UPI001A080DE6|nr:sulfur oxidation c-type cytochrome SoxX [Thiomicrospira sp.]MBE0492920.1 sulfur oxidation c-type cytochrome SoxX [Thiomicrospira sp.]
MVNFKVKQALAALTVSVALFAAPVYASDDAAKAAAAAAALAKNIEEGKKLAFSRSEGNCLACHMIQEGTSPGNIGPALIAMKLRYPDRQKLFDKIWGVKETQVPYSMMPLFGRNAILSDDQINKLVDYMYTL